MYIDYSIYYIIIMQINILNVVFYKKIFAKYLVFFFFFNLYYFLFLKKFKCFFIKLPLFFKLIIIIIIKHFTNLGKLKFKYL